MVLVPKQVARSLGDGGHLRQNGGTMSWLLARIYDPFMRRSEDACLAQWRRELLAPLSGKVLEIGAGTGTNLDHYPKLRRLVLSEPDPHMRALLAPRAAAHGAELLADGGERLSLPDQCFDAVVSTLVLCSVTDPDATLREIRRVLRPGGRLVFLEHGAADGHPARLRWQRRLEPLWRRIAGGCHLTRRPVSSIEAQGFEVEWSKRESVRKALPIVRPSVRGVARRP